MMVQHYSFVIFQGIRTSIAIAVSTLKVRKRVIIGTPAKRHGVSLAG